MISTDKQDSIELYFSEFAKHDALESWLDLNIFEQSRASKYTHEQDQMAFTIVRSVLKRILSDKIGISIQEISFDQNRYGKLSCSQVPNLHFSIAHSDEAFVLAFSKNGQIGVDIESMHREIAVEKLEQLVFTKNERATFCALRSTEEKQRKIRYTWTQKEALTKCLGITLQEGMQGYEVREAVISPFDLQKADELFLTNVISGIQPITQYRKKSYGLDFSREVVKRLNVSLQLN
jgi:phosphopantetheinyl transferase